MRVDIGLYRSEPCLLTASSEARRDHADQDTDDNDDQHEFDQSEASMVR